MGKVCSASLVISSFMHRFSCVQLDIISWSDKLLKCCDHKAGHSPPMSSSSTLSFLDDCCALAFKLKQSTIVSALVELLAPMLYDMRDMVNIYALQDVKAGCQSLAYPSAQYLGREAGKLLPMHVLLVNRRFRRRKVS